MVTMVTMDSIRSRTVSTDDILRDLAARGELDHGEYVIEG